MKNPFVLSNRFLLLASGAEGVLHETADDPVRAVGRDGAKICVGGCDMAETFREFMRRAVRDDLTREEIYAEHGRRRDAAEPLLRERLVPGCRMRAKEAVPGAWLATFVFSHWEGRWIVAKGRRSISPSSVESVEGELIRV